MPTPAADRLDTYLVEPATPQASLAATDTAISDALTSNEALGNLVTEVELDVEANTVVVGAKDVNEVESLLTQLLGPNMPITVVHQPEGLEYLAGRNRASGRMLAGDRIITLLGECTAGFGAYEDRSQKSNGQPIRARFLLTTGHCAPLDSYVERSPLPEFGNPELWTVVGQITRSAFQVGQWQTDAAAIRLDNGLGPRAIYVNGGAHQPVRAPAKAKLGDVLCFSGTKTDRIKCESVVARRTFRNGNFQGKMYVVPFSADRGDSGAPVWNARTKAAVGLISARPENDHRLTFVTPLLTIPYVSSEKAPGALNAPGMYSLNLITGD